MSVDSRFPRRFLPSVSYTVLARSITHPRPGGHLRVRLLGSYRGAATYAQARCGSGRKLQRCLCHDPRSHHHRVSSRCDAFGSESWHVLLFSYQWDDSLAKQHCSADSVQHSHYSDAWGHHYTSYRAFIHIRATVCCTRCIHYQWGTIGGSIVSRLVSEFEIVASCLVGT
jgi:hypothetical protein